MRKKLPSLRSAPFSALAVAQRIRLSTEALTSAVAMSFSVVFQLSIVTLTTEHIEYSAINSPKYATRFVRFGCLSPQNKVGYRPLSVQEHGTGSQQKNGDDNGTCNATDPSTSRLRLVVGQDAAQYRRIFSGVFASHSRRLQLAPASSATYNLRRRRHIDYQI